jgi:uncharacterized protein
LIVVSDTSPVLNLARIGRLDLLVSLYHHVVSPSAVYEELIRSQSDLPPAGDLASQAWLTVATANDRDRVRELLEYLDPGEADAIVLAIELRADLLLVDERRGRRVASESGLAITGLLGVIAAAKRAGLVELAKPLLDELIHGAHFLDCPGALRRGAFETRRIVSATFAFHATLRRNTLNAASSVGSILRPAGLSSRLESCALGRSLERCKVRRGKSPLA